MTAGFLQGVRFLPAADFPLEIKMEWWKSYTTETLILANMANMQH
jgi:hypothetical protein